MKTWKKLEFLSLASAFVEVEAINLGIAIPIQVADTIAVAVPVAVVAPAIAVVAAMEVVEIGGAIPIQDVPHEKGCTEGEKQHGAYRFSRS